MRINLTCLMLLIAFMQVTLAANAQKISLSKRNAPLTEIFKELRKQSGYDFVINKDQIKIAKPVTILVNGDDLINVLNKCFEDQPFTYSMEDRMIIVVNKKPEKVKVNTAPIDVKGRLIDENGGALVGASVSIKGTSRKTVTNDNGDFSFTSVDENSVLVISFIGYEVKEVSAITDLGNIVMTVTTSKLDEVAVISTGYQNVISERLTGSYQQLDNRILSQQVSTTITSRLEAIGNGVTVDRTTTSGRLTIRGLSSISGPKDVLIVLDNFPYDGDIANINPNDVESISILKDAAATSIWGSRAGNGVIVITSKRGRLNSKLKLSGSAVSTFTEKPDLYKVPVLSSSDYIDVENFLYDKGVFLADYNSTARVGLTPVIETLYDQTLNANEKQLALNRYRQYDVRDDFNRYFYKIGVNQQYSVQASAGGERYSWTASGGYDRNQGNLGELYNRLNLRYGLDITLLKNLKAEASFAYARVTSKNGKKGYGEITALDGTLYPYAQLADADGHALPLVQDYRLSYLTSLSPRLLDWKYYPLTDDDHNRSTTISNDININTGLSYMFKGIELKVLYRFEHQLNNQSVLQDVESYYTRNQINRFTQINGAVVTYPLPKGGINDQRNNVLNAHDLRLQGSYNKRLGAHGIDLFIAGERRELIKDGANSRYYGYDPNTLAIANVDYLNRYPNYITGSTAQIINPASLTRTNNRFVSLVGNLTYDYDGRYFIYGSARRDASNLFGVSTNNKWKPLWSTGLAWVISKEKFFSIDNLEYLKLRGSFGQSGNADPSQVALTTIAYSSFIGFTQLQSATISKFYNPDLRWETVQTTNIGIDFNALKGRLSGSVDFYAKKGKDLFSFFPIDYTTGVSTPVRNVASMSGHGLDIALSSLNLKGNLEWGSTLNFSTNRDRITDYYNLAVNGDSYVGTTAQVSGLVGKPVYSIFSYRSGGLDNTGNPIGYLAGNISKDYLLLTGTGTGIQDLKYSGSALPTLFGNLQNRFSFKGISLQVAISYKLGYYFRASSINYTNLIGLMKGHPDYALRWQKPGDELTTKIPSFEYPTSSARDRFYNGSEVLVEKGDHIRLQYINLSYSIPKKILGKSVGSCEIYLNSTNLGLLWRANKKGIDPEYQDVINPSKTISAGLRINL